jgi:hypothetical protein
MHSTTNGVLWTCMSGHTALHTPTMVPLIPPGLLPPAPVPSALPYASDTTTLSGSGSWVNTSCCPCHVVLPSTVCTANSPTSFRLYPKPLLTKANTPATLPKSQMLSNTPHLLYFFSLARITIWHTTYFPILLPSPSSISVGLLLHAEDLYIPL